MLDSSLGARYVGDMDRMFDSYAELLPADARLADRRLPQGAGGLRLRLPPVDPGQGARLPAGSAAGGVPVQRGHLRHGQAYEALLLRMRAHPLPEARAYADMMLDELRKVIPSFLQRVDLPDRGGVWSEYLEDTRAETDAVAGRLWPDRHDPAEAAPLVRLVEFDPAGEDKAIAAMCMPHMAVSDSEVLARVRASGPRTAWPSSAPTSAGARTAAIVRGGRSSARATASTLCPTTGRSATCSGTACSPSSGSGSPRRSASDPRRRARRRPRADVRADLERSAELYDDLRPRFPEQAAYAVALAFRMRYVMQMNAREAMHLLELRSGEQGHPSTAAWPRRCTG